MSDIHQEWRDLRAKNGEFLSHLDCAMAKLEKEKKQMLYDPMTCTYYMGALNNALNNNAQYWQEKHAELMLELKDAMAEINNLKHENLKLGEDLKQAKSSAKMLSDAYIKVIDENANLQKQFDAAQKEVNDFTVMYNKAHAEAHQAKAAKDRMGYSIRCMQSKITKQSNEIDKLKQALGTSAKDTEANFNRGRIKGMEEIWYELKDCFDGRAIGENQKIFGCSTVGDMLMNLSPTWFINRAEEYHEQEEKQTKDIQLGDEVEIFDTFCPDDDPHSDIGIVIAIDKDNPCFAVIGPQFEGCFDEIDIQRGNVKKTGRHFDSIPLDYFK